MKETPHTWIRPITFQGRDIDVDSDVPHTIQAVIPTLSPWERSLLQDMVLLAPEATIWESLQSGQCFMASDGSAPRMRGSFAWIMSDASGNRLARCSGPVFGYAISSYRAEGYGLLSALRFLYHMSRLHLKSSDRIITPHLVCDNKGLLATIMRLREYTTIFPNITMEAEWDCISQILDTIRALNSLLPSLDHIKGHQDENTPYEELPLLAQLNCDADAQANSYLTTNPLVNHTLVHQFPAGECLLQLPQGTITRDLKHTCAETRHLPVLTEYICKKSGWATRDVFEFIDWEAHGHALQRHGKHRTTLVKYLHNILPIGKQVHCYNQKYPPNCPSCHADLEDIDHFWNCPAPARLRWQ